MHGLFMALQPTRARSARPHILPPSRGKEKRPQSQALWSFHASQADSRHMAATISSVSSIVRPRPMSRLRTSVAATMKPELTILFAATVRAVCDLATVVVRKAWSGTANMRAEGRGVGKGGVGEGKYGGS